MSEKTARGHIEFLSDCMDYPEGLCKEDWQNLRPKLERACCFVDEELRDKGRQAKEFFNRYFYQSSK